MINILLPMAGDSPLFDPGLYPYPLPLTELGGKPMIDHVINNLSSISNELRFIFVVKRSECSQFHLDYTLSLLAPNYEIIRLDGQTKGALCSALMAVSYIDNIDPLIIVNFDQIFSNGLCSLVKELQFTKCDAGCLVFDSVHPRWSYVKLEDGLVVEAAEKKPISRNAIAGFYYFAQGSFFVQSAKRVILNQSMVNDRFFISSTFNELILDKKVVKAVKVPQDSYHSFYTPQRIEDYEAMVKPK
ncbi:MAG: putative nucleotidyltransferase [Burkholderiales bacterium]|jgi:NDP-sugar pyrophosphorylase family protein|nr:putative nucleotidyltransferase [Burkholderiales bacterium]